MTIDLYRLEQLVAVAEAGSVTRAAERLHLSQQALSTSLRTLEREVGVDLFDRSGPRIRLRPAGEALVADARVLGGLATAAVQRARRIGRGEPEVLHVGHTPAVTDEEVAELVRTVHRAEPGLRVRPHLRYPAELLGELLDARLDLGLSRAMLPGHGIAQATLTRNRLALAVSAEHRLAGRDRVQLTDLAEETVVVWGEPGSSGYTDLLRTLCRQAGFEPKITRSDMQGVAPVIAVIGTGHVAFVTAAPGPAAGGAAYVVPLEPAIHVPLVAMWLDHTTSAARTTFLQTLRDAPDPAPGS